MVRMKILDICAFGIYQTLNFMFKIKANITSRILESQLTDIHH